MKKFLLNVAILGVACFLLAGTAKADDIHLCNVSTGCSASSLQPFSGTQAFVTGNPTGDAMFLLALIPNHTASGVTSAAGLWSALGLSGGTQPNFSALFGQDAPFAGFTPTGFTFVVTSLGAWTGSGPFTIPSEPVGTVFMVYTTDGNGNVLLTSPFSSDLVITAAPEPSSVGLLAVGLLGLLVLAGRKRLTA
jgi:PEP-CTERM motif